jgi:tetratricopeptide (TPR) repeat protein
MRPGNEAGRFTGDSKATGGPAVPDSLGQALREARRNSGLSFRRFARQAGYSESHLRSVENSHRAVTDDVAAAYDRVLATGGQFALALARAGDAGTPAPWEQSGTLAVLVRLTSGGRVDRRTFIAASAAAMAVLAAHWKSALASPGPLLPGTGSRQVGQELVSHIGQRLDHLRHLDDELGSGDLATLARSELALIVRLLRGGSYTDAVGRCLYALAAEASRQAAWDYFDQDNHPAARWYFEAALRASATAGDPVTGAYALSFAAVQCYSTGEPQDAVALLETASDAVARTGTPKMAAMLAARSARAHSRAGSKRDCARQLQQARAALDRGPHPDDAPVLYWVTHGEIEMIAGSSALDLGDPAQAIRCFDAAIAADYRGDDQYPRSHAIYLARAAEAHLRLHDLDAALDRAAHAVRCLGGVDSARSTSAITGLRAKLAPHAASPAVREFLDATRQ